MVAQSPSAPNGAMRGLKEFGAGVLGALLGLLMVAAWSALIVYLVGHR